MTVKMLNNLKNGEQIESKTFEAGGRRWFACVCLQYAKWCVNRKVNVVICGNDTNTFDGIKILLVSCNYVRVRAHVTLAVELNGKFVSFTHTGVDIFIAAKEFRNTFAFREKMGRSVWSYQASSDRD